MSDFNPIAGRTITVYRMGLNTMLIRIVTALLGCSVLLSTGCIVVPIPTGEGKVLDGAPVKDNQLDSLIPNVTTKEEVIEILGSPIHQWLNGRAFSYNWTVRQGVVVYAAGGGAGPNSAVAGAHEIPKRYVVLIQFDEQDRLQRFEKIEHFEFHSYANYKAFVDEWIKNPDRIRGSSPPMKVGKRM